MFYFLLKFSITNQRSRSLFCRVGTMSLDNWHPTFRYH